MSFIYKYKSLRGFIKGVNDSYLQINDITHNPPLPTIWVRRWRCVDFPSSELPSLGPSWLRSLKAECFYVIIIFCVDVFLSARVIRTMKEEEEENEEEEEREKTRAQFWPWLLHQTIQQKACGWRSDFTIFLLRRNLWWSDLSKFTVKQKSLMVWFVENSAKRKSFMVWFVEI